MALYVHPENQTLLWETINKSPLIQQAFQNKYNEKTEWFRGIVKQVYSSIPVGKSLTRDELQQYNRNTITTLLSSVTPLGGGIGTHTIRAPGGAVAPTTIPQWAQVSSATQNTPVRQTGGVPPPPVSILKEPMTEFSRNMGMGKKNEFQEQFSNRQKEYETMFQKPLPKEINFSETMEDGVITNMEELIQKEKRQREMEISQQFTVGIAPPVSPVATIDPQAPPANTFVQFSTQPPAPPTPPQTHTIPKKLQITEEIVAPSPTEILTPDPLGVPPPAAEINLYDNWRETMMTEMEKMRRQIEVLQETLAKVTMKKEEGEVDVCGVEVVGVDQIGSVTKKLVENVIQEVIDKIQKDNL
jgi:hypothetical protein